MKLKIYPVYLLFFLSSCSNYFLYTGVQQKKSLTDIPLVAHHNEVDVLFNNAVPAQPFYKVKMVEAAANVNASYDELLQRLKQNAAAEGLDAVLVIDRQRIDNYRNLSNSLTVKDTALSFEGQQANPYQKIAAVGFKYLSRINYMDTIVKSTMIDIYEDGKTRKLDIGFDYYGNMLTTGNKFDMDFYEGNIAPFDITRHLTASVDGWQYSLDAFGQVQAFKMSLNGKDYVSATIQRVTNQEIGSVLYKIWNAGTNKYIKYQLNCIENAQGKLAEKQLYRKNSMIWKEQITYKENTITGYNRYAEANGAEILLFKADNYFYKVTDLPTPAVAAAAEKNTAVQQQ